MLAERLSALGPTDDVPRWDELTSGEDDVAGQLDAVDPALVPVLGEVLAGSWDLMDEDVRSDVTLRLVSRVHVIDDPLTYAATVDRLTPAAAILGGEHADRLHAILIEAIEAAQTDDPAPHTEARARFGLDAATDLVAAEAVRPYRLMAVLDQLAGAMPADIASPAARAAGRHADTQDDDLYRRVLEAALAEPSAQADAALELGHRHLRAAAVTGDLTELDRAREFYDDALCADEIRPEAAAFRAVVEIITVFAAGAGEPALAAAVDQLEHAVGELRLYTATEAPSDLLVQVGAWLEFAWRVRNAATRLEMRNVLELSEALQALLEVYSDGRTRVLGGIDSGLTQLLRPRIERWVAENELSRAALAEFVESLADDSPLRPAADRLLEITEETLGKAQRFRFRPRWPGGFALDD